jgi:predicted enzyme related to lactoylglutathione lyase
MGCSIYTVTIDSADPAALARFWAEVLDYKITFEEDEEVEIKPKEGSGDALLFVKDPEKKVVKNRLHFDLNPTDQKAEVERVKGLGATEADIGQSDVPWVVLADPEGNEFCILTAR